MIFITVEESSDFYFEGKIFPIEECRLMNFSLFRLRFPEQSDLRDPRNGLIIMADVSDYSRE